MFCCISVRIERVVRSSIRGQSQFNIHYSIYVHVRVRVRVCVCAIHLQVHSDSMVDIPWLIAHATYDENLWICGKLQGKHDVQFRFAPSDPAAQPGGAGACKATSAGWQKVADARKAASSPADFDASLERELSLVVATPPSAAYPTLEAVWGAFQGCLNAASGLIFYEPVHQLYLERAFAVFAADGIQVVELRQVLQGDIGRSKQTTPPLSNQ